MTEKEEQLYIDMINVLMENSKLLQDKIQLTEEIKEGKSEWYAKLRKKLIRIEEGGLKLSEYIIEVSNKIIK